MCEKVERVMTSLLLTAVFWFALAIVIACMEIEAEGKFGWAEKMPTWYRTKGVAAHLYGMIMGGKPLTGYHSFCFFLPIMILHAQFVQGIEWTVRAELMCWAMYFAWCPLWDYLWFVLNPNYTVKNFHKENVWWHAESPWIFNRMPLDHPAGWALSFAFAIAATYWGANDLTILKNHGFILGAFVILTIVTIIAAPLYHRWYRYMRRTDDRPNARITHTLPPG